MFARYRVVTAVVVVLGVVVGVVEMLGIPRAAISKAMSSPLGVTSVALVAVGLWAILILPRVRALWCDRLERLTVAILPILILAVVVTDAVWRNPTEAAALGTVSAIGYVAYQSWHTRRAADAAVRGLVTAEHALRVSQAMAAEAEKRRLDLRAPTVRVSIGEPDWPPSRPRLLANPGQTESSPYIPGTRLEAGYVYRLPKNRDDVLGLWVEGQVCNEGSTTVEVEMRGIRMYDPPVVPGGCDVDPDDIVLTNPGTFRRSLPPGRTLCFRLQGESPVSAWITNYRARHSGAQGTWDDPRVAARGRGPG
jgi:hypothetical protein